LLVVSSTLACLFHQLPLRIIPDSNGKHRTLDPLSRSHNGLLQDMTMKHRFIGKHALYLLRIPCIDPMSNPNQGKCEPTTTSRGRHRRSIKSEKIETTRLGKHLFFIQQSCRYINLYTFYFPVYSSCLSSKAHGIGSFKTEEQALGKEDLIFISNYLFCTGVLLDWVRAGTLWNGQGGLQ